MAGGQTDAESEVKGEEQAAEPHVLVCLGIPSVHPEPCEEADSVFNSFWDDSRHRLQLAWSEACWELKVFKHSRHNTHGGAMAKRVDKGNTKTFATERKGHIYSIGYLQQTRSVLLHWRHFMSVWRMQMSILANHLLPSWGQNISLAFHHPLPLLRLSFYLSR